METNTRKETLEDYFNLIPECLRSKTFILGGAATDLVKADDVDMVILTQEASIKELQAKLKMCCLGDVEPILQTVRNYTTAIEGEICMISPLALKKPIHFMLSRAGGIKDILNDFDLSVHQFAYDSKGTCYGVSTSTLPFYPIVVLKFDSPVTTLERYRKLCSRYSLPEDPTVVADLSSL